MLESCTNLTHLCLSTKNYSDLISTLVAVPTRLRTFVTSPHALQKIDLDEELLMISSLQVAQLYMLPYEDEVDLGRSAPGQLYWSPKELEDRSAHCVGMTSPWYRYSYSRLNWKLLPGQPHADYLQMWDELRMNLE